MIQFRTNFRRTAVAMAFLDNLKKGLPMWRVINILFEAEIQHLNRHGRPIFGDVYTLWPDRVRGYATCGLLLNDPLIIDAARAVALPIEVGPTMRARVVLNEDGAGSILNEFQYRLSETDRWCIEYALDEVGGQGDPIHGELLLSRYDNLGILQKTQFGQVIDYEDLLFPENAADQDLVGDLRDTSLQVHL